MFSKYKIKIYLHDEYGEEYVQEVTYVGVSQIELTKALFSEFFDHPSDSGLSYFDFEVEIESDWYAPNSRGLGFTEINSVELS